MSESLRPSLRARQFTSGEAVMVDVGAIERELSALWRKASESDDAVTRACLCNVVVFSGSEAEHTAASDLLDTVVPSVPARVLAIRRAAGAGPEVAAWVSAHCHLAPGGGKLVCSEEVTLETRGRGEEHVPALVLALAVPDVPTAFLALSSFPLDNSATRLLQGVGTIVVDTAVDHGVQRLRALGELPDALAIVDFAWLRLARFRWLLASLFDPPASPKLLRDIREVRLRAAPAGDAPARLTLGWLTSRLGWTNAVLEKRSASTRVWRAEARGEDVTMRLSTDAADAGRDGVVSIELVTQGGQVLSIADSGRDSLEVRSPTVGARVVAAPERSDGELLAFALGSRAADPIFTPSLAAALSLED